MTDQLTLGGMPRRLFRCTPSRLASWADCPRRYRMIYLDRPTPKSGPPWAHNSVGAAVHNALRMWWDEPLDGRTVAAAVALVDRCWIADGFRDDRQAADAQVAARAWVSDYVAGLDPRAEPVGVERTVAAKTISLALSGRIDRLDDRDGDLVVVDYKTGRRELTVDDARGSVALALYAFAAGQTMRRPCLRVELHHLPRKATLSWQHTPDSLARQVRRAELAAADIVAAEAALAAGADSDEVFPARPGPLCGWCDLRAHCPLGQLAGPRCEPWAGIAHGKPAVP